MSYSEACLEYIRKTYHVPAYKNVEVIVNGKPGKIIGAYCGYGAHLLIRLLVCIDGKKKSYCYHPTSEITYLIESNLMRSK